MKTNKATDIGFVLASFGVVSFLICIVVIAINLLMSMKPFSLVLPAWSAGWAILGALVMYCDPAIRWKLWKYKIYGDGKFLVGLVLTDIGLGLMGGAFLTWMENNPNVVWIAPAISTIGLFCLIGGLILLIWRKRGYGVRE